MGERKHKYAFGYVSNNFYSFDLQSSLNPHTYSNNNTRSHTHTHTHTQLARLFPFLSNNDEDDDNDFDDAIDDLDVDVVKAPSKNDDDEELNSKRPPSLRSTHSHHVITILENGRID